jgi:predicted small lipoprotein YifL
MLRDFYGTHLRIATAMTVVVAIGAAPLAGCGIKGPLKPPPAPATSAPAAEPATVPPPEPSTGKP